MVPRMDNVTCTVWKSCWVYMCTESTIEKKVSIGVRMDNRNEIVAYDSSLSGSSR